MLERGGSLQSLKQKENRRKERPKKRKIWEKKKEFRPVAQALKGGSGNAKAKKVKKKPIPGRLCQKIKSMRGKSSAMHLG